MKNLPHGSPQMRTKRARSKSGFLIVLTIGSLVTFSGCTGSSHLRQVLAPYKEQGCCLTTNIRARHDAQKLWRAKYAHCYGRHHCARDIRQGFIDGYVDTVNGGSGSAPIVPPEQYCVIGRKVEANCWFQGYPLGVAAAESSGACEANRTPISPALAACFAQPRCAPGCVPVPDACGCGQVGCHGSCGTVPASPMMQQPMMFDNNVQMHQPTVVQEPIMSSGQEMVPAAPQTPTPVPAIDPNRIQDTEIRSLQQSAPEIDAPPKPSEVIERAIDNAADEVTEAISISQPLVNNDDVFQVPSHRTPTSGQKPTVNDGPVEAPRFDLSAAMPKSEIVAEVKSGIESSETSIVEQTQDTVFGGEKSPVVSGPIEMPNIQVNFEWTEPDWLFGEVDITRALLEQDVPSVLDNQ